MTTIARKKTQPDVAVTADRVSAHEALNSADKAARRVLNKGLAPYLEYQVLPKLRDRDSFMAADVIVFLSDHFPHLDKLSLNGALAVLARKKDGPLRRIGGMKSGLYTFRGRPDPQLSPSQPTADELIQTILTALTSLSILANRSSKVEARLKELGITISVD